MEIARTIETATMLGDHNDDEDRVSLLWPKDELTLKIFLTEERVGSRDESNWRQSEFFQRIFCENLSRK